MTFTPAELRRLRLADQAEELPVIVVVRAKDRRAYRREWMRQRRERERQVEGRKRYERIAPTRIP